MLKQLRGQRSLREVATESFITKSSLHRYETGASQIPIKIAKCLDKAYQAEGWIEAAVAAIGKGRWEPWSTERTDRLFSHRWPAKYEGPVWVAVRPIPEHSGRVHQLHLTWGPWSTSVAAKVPGTPGLTLTTGKAGEEEAVVISLRTDLNVYALFGVGDDVGDSSYVINVRDRWEKSAS